METQFEMNRDAGVGYVTLGVRDLEMMSTYYQEIIGLELIESWGSGRDLGKDREIMVRLEERPGRLYKQNSGLFHLALLLPTRADLGQWLKHYISRMNRMVGGAGDHLVSEALYLDDPEGNGIEIYADRPRTTWEYEGGRIKMATLAVDIPDVLAHANPEPFTGLPAGSTLGHVHLQVDEIEAAQKFYIEGIGLGHMTNYPGATFLGIGGYHHHIGGNIWRSRGNGQPPAGSLGLLNYSFTLSSDAARKQVLDNLDLHDVAIEMKGDVPELLDPAGNRIRLELSLN